MTLEQGSQLGYAELVKQINDAHACASQSAGIICVLGEICVDFIEKVEGGNAYSKKTYQAMKRALTDVPKCSHQVALEALEKATKA